MLNLAMVVVYALLSEGALTLMEETGSYLGWAALAAVFLFDLLFRLTLAEEDD